MRVADGANAIDVDPGFDLELDAPVALLQVAAHLLEERLGRGCDPDAHAALRRARSAPSQVLPGTLPLRSQLRIDERIEQGWPWPSGCRGPPRSTTLDGGDVHVARAEQRGREEVAEHEPGSSLNSPLKSGCDVGDALSPALGLVGLHANQDAALVAHLPEAGPERANERQLDEEQLDAPNAAHGVLLGHEHVARSAPVEARRRSGRRRSTPPGRRRRRHASETPARRLAGVAPRARAAPRRSRRPRAADPPRDGASRSPSAAPTRSGARRGTAPADRDRDPSGPRGDRCDRLD